MWASMLAQANKVSPEGVPTKILDLGCGPGEPACHFATYYNNVPVIASDIAPTMVGLAEARAKSKGLGNVETMVLDMEDLSPIESESVDLVIAQMSYMFVPDKDKAMAETFRVLKPGGVLVANVWVSFELIPIAGGLMSAVVGAPSAPPAPNPNGPLSLADANVFDDYLMNAGFEFTSEHNFEGTFVGELGPLDDLQSFKMAALPVWDALTELEESGAHPDAWEKAKAAFPEVAAPYVNEESGGVTVEGAYRLAVAQKPMKSV